MRITSPQDRRVRGLLGFFWQEQKHEFWQPFIVEGLADIMWPNQGRESAVAQTWSTSTAWTARTRTRPCSRSVSFDVTEKLVELTGGLRWFKAETTVEGFFGFGLGFDPGHAPGDGPLPPDGPDESAEPGNPDNGGSGAS